MAKLLRFFDDTNVADRFGPFAIRFQKKDYTPALDLMKNASQFSAAQINFLSVGFILSFVFAMLSVKFLLNFIKHHSFISFGIYRIILALSFWLFSIAI